MEAKEADKDHFCGCLEDGAHKDDPVMGAKIDNITLESWDSEDKAWWNEFVSKHWKEM